MSSEMRNNKWLSALLIFITLLTLAIIGLGWGMYSLSQRMQNQLAEGWFEAPVEFYSSPLPFARGQLHPSEDIHLFFQQQGFRRRQPDQQLWPQDYSFISADRCQELVNGDIDEQAVVCLVYSIPSSTAALEPEAGVIHLVAFDDSQQVVDLFLGSPAVRMDSLNRPSQLLAQYYGDRPIRQRIVPLGEVPLQCLQAITAIEDEDFLDHMGISPSGLLRATLKNLLRGRYAQGGSTITQQLVKNYFLTSEKTLRRKFKELLMAIILEGQFSKDEILQAYLNVIYMGQSGAFAVHGFGAAADHYFNQPLSKLGLAECALLSAIVNSPGRYDPFRHPERAKKRRAKVLDKMLELNWVDRETWSAAQNTQLPKSKSRGGEEPAPYFLQAVRQQLKSLKIDSSQGLRVYTTLSWPQQILAQKALPRVLDELEKKVEKLGNKSSDSGQKKNLQSLLISVYLPDNRVVALVGGRNYRESQYNRATEAHRQVGSVMKPIVYLAALESLTPEGNAYGPLTPLEDSPLEYSYQGQVWSPQNYDKKFRGNIPLFYALKESLNVPTARLALDVGLESVIDMARRLGVESRLEALPSLALGAFELYPMEVAQTYATIGRFGQHLPLHLMQRVEDLKGNEVWRFRPEERQVVSADRVAVLLGMLKNTVFSGTARSLVTWRGLEHPAAGKTGTTSDMRDAWFVGLTPTLLTLAWVGYDDNSPHGLTGASGALPLWWAYMKEALKAFPKDDFAWPEDTVTSYELSGHQLKSLLMQPQDKDELGAVLTFQKGQEPR